MRFNVEKIVEFVMNMCFCRLQRATAADFKERTWMGRNMQRKSTPTCVTIRSHNSINGKIYSCVVVQEIWDTMGGSIPTTFRIFRNDGRRSY